jgi:hypothetical protein
MFQLTVVKYSLLTFRRAARLFWKIVKEEDDSPNEAGNPIRKICRRFTQ